MDALLGEGNHTFRLSPRPGFEQHGNGLPRKGSGTHLISVGGIFDFFGDQLHSNLDMENKRRI